MELIPEVSPHSNKPRSIFDYKSENQQSTSFSLLSKTTKIKKVGDRLSKMFNKYDGVIDTTQLHIVQESMERAQNLTSRAKEVPVDGKIMIISDPVRKLVINFF